MCVLFELMTTAAGVIDTGGAPCIWNIFGNLKKNLNGSNGINRAYRPGGRKFMKKTEVKKLVTLSLYNVSNLTVTLGFILSGKGVKSCMG
jgi:hypothetical protein